MVQVNKESVLLFISVVLTGSVENPIQSDAQVAEPDWRGKEFASD